MRTKHPRAHLPEEHVGEEDDHDHARDDAGAVGALERERQSERDRSPQARKPVTHKKSVNWTRKPVTKKNQLTGSTKPVTKLISHLNPQMQAKQTLIKSDQPTGPLLKNL